MRLLLSDKGSLVEPTSVLDTTSPSTTTSTSSASGGPAATVAAVSGWAAAGGPEWASELQPIPDTVSDIGGLGLEDWEAIFADSGGVGDVPVEFSNLGSGTLVDHGVHGIQVQAYDGTNIDGCKMQKSFFSNPTLPQFAPAGLFFPVNLEEKPLLPRQRQLVGPVGVGGGVQYNQQHHHQAMLDQLLQAAEMVETGNSVSAIAILARLNHQLPSPAGKPLIRSAFYFKEALQLLTGPESPRSHVAATPLEVLLKLGAYKAFSEVSPVLQFTNFTCTQAVLEEVRGAESIHIVDFDIGVGGQWSSFMQELSHCRGNAAPVLKITAFISAAAHHPFELHLIRDNLYHFAADLGIPFELRFLSLESFDPAELLCLSGGNEAIAVHLPVGSVYNPPVPSLLRLVKQLSPKIVVSVDHGCNRSDLPFSQYFLHALQSSMVLLDSIDASGTNSEVASKIERFLLQPRIEGAVIGRHCAGDRMPPWRMLFASAGFMPVHFSNFTEAQAECLLKRVPVRGFHVEKRHASLFLHWQHRELASVSAWRC